MKTKTKIKIKNRKGSPAYRTPSFFKYQNSIKFKKNKKYGK
jgi:hypothetical protein